MRILRNKWFWVGAAAFLVLTTISFQAGCKQAAVEKTPMPGAATATPVAATPTPTPGPRFAGRPDAQPKDIELLVGESAVLEGMEVTLTKVDRMTRIGFLAAATGKEFVIITVKMENVDTKTHRYEERDFRIQTAGGQVLDRLVVSVEPRLGPGDLVAGGRVEGTVAFEAPIETGHQYILYKPNPLRADRIVVEIS